jgi:hypothetical protein
MRFFISDARAGNALPFDMHKIDYSFCVPHHYLDATDVMFEVDVSYGQRGSHEVLWGVC